MTQKIACRCIVSGRVQGVFFRANTQQHAQKLGLTGWVRNLSDGRVEVFACGDEAQIDSLKTWLKRGPRAADVTDFVSQPAPFTEHADFVVAADGIDEG